MVVCEVARAKDGLPMRMARSRTHPPLTSCRSLLPQNGRHQIFPTRFATGCPAQPQLSSPTHNLAPLTVLLLFTVGACRSDRIVDLYIDVYSHADRPMLSFLVCLCFSFLFVFLSGTLLLSLRLVTTVYGYTTLRMPSYYTLFALTIHSSLDIEVLHHRRHLAKEP